MDAEQPKYHSMNQNYEWSVNYSQIAIFKECQRSQAGEAAVLERTWNLTQNNEFVPNGFSLS